MRQNYREGDEPVPGYQLKRWLGEGGFGVAWRAKAPGGTEVAMKMIDLSAKNALKEIRALGLVKQIRHPNLTPILALWLRDADGNVREYSEADTQELLAKPNAPAPIPKDTMLVDSDVWRSRPAELIMAMGLGDKTLSDRLDECVAGGMEGIPAEELLEYLESAAKAIDYLNSAQHNIQHCDIKPQNILIVGGAAQVCDFGLARALQDNRATKVAVSYAYAAPESFQSKPSHATDQYSLAITYVELRTGTLPFDDESIMGVMNAHINGKLNLSRLPEVEREVIRRATAVDPNQRYDSALKMIRALRRAYEASADPTASPPPLTSSVPSSPVLRVSTSEEVVPGYRLLRQLTRSSTEEAWEAAAPGGKRVGLVIRELAESAAALDLEALSLVLRTGHPNLTEMLAFWLIDQEGNVLPDEQLATIDRSRLGKLVLAGKLSASTMLQLLNERRQRSGKGIPPAELLPLMKQVATALDFLNTRQHKSGQRKVALLHGNVQPANLLLYNTTVRLGNFGRARALDADEIEDSVAAAGFEMAYTPPEVFEGRLTRWTDQYGLALSYVHLRAGKPAFDAASSTTRLIQLHRRGELDFRELPEREVEVLRRATALEPAERFPTCAEFISELGRACGMKSSGGAMPAVGAGEAPSEKGKTQPIGSIATQEIDEGFTQDTSSNDSSIIETQSLPEPSPRLPTPAVKSRGIEVTSDWPGAEEYLAQQAEREAAARAAWEVSVKGGRGAGSKLLAAGLMAVILALGGALVWAIWPSPASTQQIPNLLELTELTDRAQEPGVDAHELREIGQKIDELEARSESQEAFVLLRGEVREARRIIGAHALDDPALDELESMLSADKLPNANAANASEAYLKLVREVLEKKQSLDERAKGEPAFKDAMDARLRDKLALLRNKARGAALASPEPRDAKPLLELLLELDPTDAETLMALSRLALNADGTESAEMARQRLRFVTEPQVAAIAPPDAQAAAKTEWEFLKDWLVVRSSLAPTDPNGAPAESPENINRALNQLENVFRQRNPKLRDEEVASVTRDIAALWQQKPEFLAASRGALKAGIELNPNNAAARQHYALLLDRWLPDQIGKQQELNAPWFNDRKNECDLVLSLASDAEFKNLPLVKLLKAECLLSTDSSSRPGDSKEAESLVADVGAPPPEFQAYRAYVQSLLLARQLPQADGSKMAQSVDEMLAGVASNQALGLDDPFRRNKAGEIAANAAFGLRTSRGAGDRKQVEWIVGNRWRDQDEAARAARFLDASRSLLTSSPNAWLLANLSLAAYHGGLAPELAQEAVRQVLPQLDKPSTPDDETAKALANDRLALTWVSARTQANDVAGRRAEIAQSARVVEEYQKINRLDRLDLPQAQLLFDRVVAPALLDTETAETLDDPAVKQAAARLLATKGELFYFQKELRDPQKPAGGGTQAINTTSLEAYDRAIALDGDKAEYYTGRARINLLDPDKAEKDLELALSKDPRYAFALYLRALVHTRKAEPPGLMLDKRLELFEQARQACENAIELIPPGDRNRTDCQILLANSHVNLANYILDFADKEKHLHAAVENAEAAIKDNLYPSPDLAWRVLGNAQEDLAWIIGRGGRPELERYYPEAVASFEQAANLAPDLGDAWRDLGRAEYKWAADSIPDAARANDPSKYLEEQALLTRALDHAQLAQEKQNPPVDAPYWQAMALFRLGRYPEACESFAKYFAEGKTHSPDYYADYVQCAFQGLQSLQEPLEKKREVVDLAERIDAALACADRTEKLSGQARITIDPAKSAQALRTMVTAVQGKPDEAVADLVAATPDLTAATPGDLYPLAARVLCRLWPGGTKDEQADSTGRNFAVIVESNRLANLAGQSSSQYRSAAFEAAALAYTKAVNYSTAALKTDAEQKKKIPNTCRVFGIQLYRGLIGSQPHHPESWIWRVNAATLLNEEIRASAANKMVKVDSAGQPVSDEALRKEGVEYLEYVREVMPQEQGRIGNQLQRLKQATAAPN